MSYYRTCPLCGCALDPGEICEDCTNREETESEERKKAAPVAGHQGGGVETGLTAHISASSLPKNEEDCKI